MAQEFLHLLILLEFVINWEKSILALSMRSSFLVSGELLHNAFKSTRGKVARHNHGVQKDPPARKTVLVQDLARVIGSMTAAIQRIISMIIVLHRVQ